MILGVGIDLCEAQRLEKSLQKPHFCDHVFAPAEQALLAGLSGRRRTETAAANFAAKEAFLKAAGTGLAGPFALAEIEAVRLDSGAPAYRFSGRTAEWVARRHLTAHLTLSHDGGMAMAFCLLETAPDAS